MLVLEPQTSRNETLFGRALDSLLEKTLSPEQDKYTRALLEAWLTAGSMVASTAVRAPGPLKAAWGKGRHDTAQALTPEFTFPILSRWFRFVKGAVEGPPAQRLGARSAWARYVATLLWDTDVPRRLAIRTRLDSLFNNDSDANLLAGSSPRALGLVASK